MSSYLIHGQAFEAKPVAPGLYVAATPIGNLGDITLRVIETLAACDLVACEDTRVTGKLLKHYGISKPMVSHTDHNSTVTAPKLIEKLKQNEVIVLVSDAGTPLLSDPGQRLVSDVREAGLPVIPLPGASAPLAALTASGLPMNNWSFVGFLPTKQKARMEVLQSYRRSEMTVVFFESPNRIAATLSDMMTVFGGERVVTAARELTKLHEEILTESLGDLMNMLGPEKHRGEFVLLVSPHVEKDEIDPDSVLVELLKTRPVSRAAAEAAELTGLSKRELYQRALALKDNK